MDHAKHRQTSGVNQYVGGFPWLNPFTPKSDQFQISPAASPEILDYTVCRTLLYSDERLSYLPILATSLIHFIFRFGECPF